MPGEEVIGYINFSGLFGHKTLTELSAILAEEED
jgi:hypothetical protein